MSIMTSLEAGTRKVLGPPRTDPEAAFQCGVADSRKEPAEPTLNADNGHRYSSPSRVDSHGFNNNASPSSPSPPSPPSSRITIPLTIVTEPQPGCASIRSFAAFAALSLNQRHTCWLTT
ncbi:hypothetical protein E4U54_008815 [Claviceps lovelessii]|nr:hypothetical protein E4U54_008815 [Claviceps lovelessii]